MSDPGIAGAVTIERLKEFCTAAASGFVLPEWASRVVDFMRAEEGIRINYGKRGGTDYDGVRFRAARRSTYSNRGYLECLQEEASRVLAEKEPR